MHDENSDSDDSLQSICPYSVSVKNIIEYFSAIGNDSRFDIARIIFSINIICHVLELLKRDFSINDYMAILDDNYLLAKNIIKNQNIFIEMLTEYSDEDFFETNNDKTRFHYSTMFSNIEDEDFFNIAPRNLKVLFELNDFRIDCPEGKIALDAGCGSGRYSYALSLLGFNRVVGIDFSPENIEFAKKKIKSRHVRDIEFLVGDVKNILFEDESFDFVLSNGVLHHVDAGYDLTLTELCRVLKPGGNAYLHVMEKPGGALLDTIDIARLVLKTVPESRILHCMKYLGFKGYAIYNVLDHVCVPVNKRVTKVEIENYINDAGFSEMRRFKRGLPNYSTELLRRNPQDIENIWKYGVGEHMYILKK